MNHSAKKKKILKRASQPPVGLSGLSFKWKRKWGKSGCECPATKPYKVIITQKTLNHLFYTDLSRKILRKIEDIRRRIRLLPAARQVIEKNGVIISIENRNARKSFLVAAPVKVENRILAIAVVLKERFDGRRIFFSVQSFGELKKISHEGEPPIRWSDIDPLLKSSLAVPLHDSCANLSNYYNKINSFIREKSKKICNGKGS